MSNSILPPLLSDSPPPLVADDEEFEDEFGDFKGSEELSFDNENPPTPSSLKNSNDYFPDSFPDINVCNVEETYQIITSEDKSTTNIRTSIPPSDYFSLWEQIENNIPEIIENEKDLENVDEKVDILENDDDFNNLTCRSKENLHGSIHHEKDFNDGLSSKSTEVYSEETTESTLELSNSLEQKEDFEEVIQQKDDIFPEINPVNQIEFDNNESCCDDLASTELSSASSFTLETDKCIYSNIENSTNKNTNNSDFHTTASISHYSINEEYSSASAQDTGIDDSSNPGECDSKKSKLLEELQTQKLSTEIEDNQESDDDFGEFADFCSSNIPIFETKANTVNIENEDDFNEFGSYQISCNTANDLDSLKSYNDTPEQTESKQKVNTQEIDEFDDFTSYSEHGQGRAGETKDCGSHTLDKVLRICKSPEDAFKETQSVLEKIFPISEYTTPDYSNCEFIMNNSVFENLKDITETNALTYQWGKSAAQKNILKTLNIDIRNILYGPAWNSGMPIFAPNLCSKPLEPIRSELPIHISPQKTIESQESASTIPQFDWTGSGLTDLQDSSQNVDQEFKTNLQTPNEEFEVIQSTYIESAPIPPKLNHLEEELSQSKKFEGKNELKECQEISDDFSDFTSYQGSTEKETNWNNMLPLRESHISSDVQQNTLETDKISIYFQELTMGKSQAVTIDQFKTSPNIINNVNSLGMFEQKLTHSESPFVFDGLEKITPKTKLQQLVQDDSLENNVYLGTQALNHCDMSSIDNFSSFKTEGIGENKEESIYDDSSTKQQEDEFSDFQSSLPCPPVPSIQPTLLEPLQPAILQPEPVGGKTLKIEWPEPGLDEEEINRIVSGVLRKNSTNDNLVEKTNNITPTETIPSKLTQNNDHDDWSDFISVKEPFKSRTSTPDLPLSVFNLGSIQPNKVSAPFVDPNGVVHSPSKTPNIAFPLANRNLQNGAPQHSRRQPFITSHAFDALYSKNSIIQPGSSRKPVVIQQSVPQFSYDNIGISTNRLEKNIGLFPQSERCQKDPHESSSAISNAEDDDWGDFVSAPNTISNSSSNFFQPLSYMKTNFGFTSKTAPTQKISSVPKNTVVKQERNSFPVISTMPDLDFVSPKSRSTIK